jgi:hypothetical protein
MVVDREIRTALPRDNPFPETQKPGERLLARLLRETTAGRTYGSLADVVSDLKTRLGRLRIRWTNDDIAAALAMVKPRIGR